MGYCEKGILNDPLIHEFLTELKYEYELELKFRRFRRNLAGRFTKSYATLDSL